MKNDGSGRYLMEERYKRAVTLKRAAYGDATLALNSSVGPHWIDESDEFWYFRKTPQGGEFRLVNGTTKTNEPAFDHDKLATALAKTAGESVDPNNLPIRGVQIGGSPRFSCFNAFDKRWRFCEDDGQCDRVDATPDPDAVHELLSPDGKMVAFVRDYNLWVRDAKTGDERQLTHDGKEFYSYAGSPLVWGVPLIPYLQACWSPDSTRLFTLQLDDRQVKRMPVMHFAPRGDDIRPYVEEYPCGVPGDLHVESQRLLAIDVKTGAHTDAQFRNVLVNRSGYGLFRDNQAWWGADSRHAYFVDCERGDHVVRVVELDTKTGQTKVLFQETSAQNVKLSGTEASSATILPIPETNELIWYSERSGWAHFYLYDLATGDMKRALTHGDWVVREIIHYDAARREVWIQTSGRTPDRDPYYLDICRVNLDTGALSEVISGDREYNVFDSFGRSLPTLLARYTDPGIAWDICGVSPSGNLVAVTHSRADELPAMTLLNRDGEELLEIEAASLADQIDWWRWPEPVKLTGADGATEIFGAVFRPSDFSPDKQYPIIDASGCSPEFSYVPKGSFFNAPYGGRWYFEAAMLAELGFIVVTIDGRGTAFRKQAFVNASYGWMPSSNFAKDRIAGIRQLAERYPYMDLDRVGIIGSDGFVSAVYGLLEHPEFYKVGVSQCFQDMRVMTSVASELFEGRHPCGHNADRYAEHLVGNLEGKLLLMHGLLDRMDHSAGTWRLIDALQRANKDFDMIMFPNDEGFPENPHGHIGTDYAHRRTWDYFVKHLLGEEPPKEFSFATN